MHTENHKTHKSDFKNLEETSRLSTLKIVSLLSVL